MYMSLQWLIYLFLLSLLVGSVVERAWAQETPSGVRADADKQQRKQELKGQLKTILDELEDLEKEEGPPAKGVTPTEEPGLEQGEPVPHLEMSDISIVSRRVQSRLEGVTLFATPRSEHESQPTRTLRESLESLPGIVLRQANGPRDFSISIRGSGVKTTFAVRDIKMYEDGIIQTQSDGLSRLDIHDPWFMQSVEALRGASSSLYGNYALGGMVHFKTRRGSDINGVESFFSGGSYGYQKYTFAVGEKYANVDISMFGSHVAEDGFIRHSGYNTQTLNFNFRVRVDDKQNLYFKAITNWLNADVPTRLTPGQFNVDPRQAGGTNPLNDAARLDQRRLDRRTIIGGLYERQLDANTVLTMEADYDLKDINQTFTQINDAVNPNYKHYTDLRHDGRLFGMALRSYVGFFVDNMEQESNAFTNLGNFQGSRGTLSQNSRGTIRNIGGRFREELEFVPKWTLAGGLGFEQSIVSAQVINYTGAGAVATRTSTDRTFYNWAPEVSLTFRPNDVARNWIRASTGYAIPGIGNLTTDLSGLAGTNFNLQPQKNVNLEIGTDAKLHETFSVQLVGFWVFFRNEIISQINPVTGQAFSINADSSEYRGIELFYDWRPAPGWRFSGAYTHIDSRYINFIDQFRVGGLGPVVQVVQDGKRVPNVPSGVLNFKEEYEHPSGWGGWIETSYYNSYFLNNANTVEIPAFWLITLNAHKTIEFKNRYIKFAKFYAQLDNLADKTYAASGNVVADSVPDSQKTLFFAGYGRAIYGGVTLGLF